MPLDVATIATGIGALKTGIDIVKSLIPKGEEGEPARLQLENAERQIQIAEAQVAEGLGYTICKCTFPPNICISEFRESPVSGRPKEVSTCPKCNQVYPPDWNLPPPQTRVVRA